MILRAATRDDAQRLWAWRNDPVARAASLSREAIALEDHLAWFDTALQAPHRQILIGLAPGPVGMVRFDQTEDAVVTSIVLAPEARGKWLARPLLQGALNLCRFRPAQLSATIRATNAPSLALFTALGFEGRRDTDPITLHRMLP